MITLLFLSLLLTVSCRRCFDPVMRVIRNALGFKAYLADASRPCRKACIIPIRIFFQPSFSASLIQYGKRTDQIILSPAETLFNIRMQIYADRIYDIVYTKDALMMCLHLAGFTYCIIYSRFRNTSRQPVLVELIFLIQFLRDHNMSTPVAASAMILRIPAIFYL